MASGTCGPNATWDLNESSGVLTISGTGAIADYCGGTSTSTNPLYSYRLKIKSVVINSGITSIGNSAFTDYQQITSVSIPNTVTSIGNSAFYYNKMSSITIPSSVTSIGNNTFQMCTALTTVNLSEGLQTIGNATFSACTRLTSIVIPNSVTSIGTWVFEGCSSMSDITFGKNITSIGGYAIYDCKRLTNITFLCKTAPTLADYSFTLSNSSSTTVTATVYTVGGWGSDDVFTEAVRGGSKYANCNIFTYVALPGVNVNINVSGTWKESTPYVNVNGEWKEVVGVYVNVNGTWKETK